MIRIPRSITATVLFCIGVSGTGCEDVINVDLKNADNRLVIEGVLRVGEGGSPVNLYFRIRRSVDFFDNREPEYVDNAVVVFADECEDYDTLQSVGGGLYRLGAFYPSAWFRCHFTPGQRVSATVSVEDQTYEAVATTPNWILIDSVAAEYQQGGGLGTGQDEGYRLHAYFNDPPGTHEYAWITLLRNGRVTSDAYYLYDGKFSDGKTIDYNYFLDVYRPGDNAFVELRAMDETIYDYLSTLREAVVWTGPTNVFDVTPANPNTNWSNGALGGFAIFAVSGLGISVPDSVPQVGALPEPLPRLAR